MSASNARHAFVRNFVIGNQSAPVAGNVTGGVSRARPSLLAAGCALAFASLQAHGFELEFEDSSWTGFIDSTLTASAAMRVQGADHKGFGSSGYTSMATGNQTVFPDAGDVYSAPLSLLTEIGLQKDNYGFFSRLSYLYDPAIMNKDCSNCFGTIRPPSPAGIAGGAPRPDGIAEDAQDTAGNQFRVLDAFVYGNWELGAHPLNVRVGKQVVNWGESNIIGGGISQMQNPIDLGKTTVPGTEVKETLMPQEMVYTSVGLTDNVTLEAYYVWNWRNTIFIPVGTLFSPFDFIGDGFNPHLAGGALPNDGFAGRNEPDGGQWGAAIHSIIESLNGADLGVYWVRSHAFVPYLGVNPAAGGYQWIYAEDVDTYAVSLSGEIPGSLGLSFQTELNFRPNYYDTRQCQNPGFGLAGAPFITSPISGSNVLAGCDIGAGDVWTYVGSLTRSAGTSWFGADKLNTVLDVQAQWIDNLRSGDPTDRMQSSSPIDRGNFPGVDALNRPITDFSWGYVAVASLEYNNAFASINVSPTIVFIHNVNGYEPFSTGALVEGQRALRSSVLFTYLSSFSFEIGYTKFIGSAGVNEDRDNVFATIKYSF